MVYPNKDLTRFKFMKTNQLDKKPDKKLKKKSLKSYPTKGVKKRVTVPMPMVQTYH